jgi:MYXO-CTERM domain-containing protein
MAAGAHCVVRDACAASETPISIVTTEPTCMGGSTPCFVDPIRDCCIEDCQGGPTCGFSGSLQPPSCCAGYCGQVGVQPNPQCDTTTVSACCLSNEIIRPAAMPGESTEWRVTFGDAIPPSDGGGADGPEGFTITPVAAPSDGGSSGCSMTSAGGEDGLWPAMGAVALVAARARRRRG